jgi:broad specificity phosphatase PhoE
MSTQRVFLIRHGETEWTLTGQHTSITDIPLTDSGRQVARRLAVVLAKVSFAAVLVSPLSRARQTCELAGFAGCAEVDGDLMEWNYGDYEGLTSKEIQAQVSGWVLFQDGCPRGESPEQVGVRVDRVITRVRAVEGNVALFAHGHLFRVLGARWIGLPVAAGRHFLLDTASVSVLGYYQGTAAVKRWNAVIKLPRESPPSRRGEMP